MKHLEYLEVLTSQSCDCWTRASGAPVGQLSVGNVAWKWGEEVARLNAFAGSFARGCGCFTGLRGYQVLSAPAGSACLGPDTALVLSCGQASSHLSVIWEPLAKAWGTQPKGQREAPREGVLEKR